MPEKSKYHLVGHEVFPTLLKYVPVVDRVHGDHHPEFHDVRRIFETIIQKTKDAKPLKPELNQEFAQLRTITQNYTIPADVCETFEAVYEMLKRVDDAYQG